MCVGMHRLLILFLNFYQLPAAKKDSKTVYYDKPSGSQNWYKNFKKFMNYKLKVAFIQKGLMNLSFPQKDKPNYFPELKF